MITMQEKVESYELCKKIEDLSVILSYHGVLTKTMTNKLLNIYTQYAEASSLNITTKKVVYSILDAGMENVLKYTTSPHSTDNKSFTLLFQQKSNDIFSLTIGNYVNSETAEFLKQYLTKIKSHSRPELKELIEKNLRKGELSEEGGAGLGLLIIAMHSNNDFNFNLIETDKKLHYFILEISIPTKKL